MEFFLVKHFIESSSYFKLYFTTTRFQHLNNNMSRISLYVAWNRVSTKWLIFRQNKGKSWATYKFSTTFGHLHSLINHLIISWTYAFYKRGAIFISLDFIRCKIIFYADEFQFFGMILFVIQNCTWKICYSMNNSIFISNVEK